MIKIKYSPCNHQKIEGYFFKIYNLIVKITINILWNILQNSTMLDFDIFQLSTYSRHKQFLRKILCIKKLLIFIKKLKHILPSFQNWLYIKIEKSSKSIAQFTHRNWVAQKGIKSIRFCKCRRNARRNKIFNIKKIHSCIN